MLPSWPPPCPECERLARAFQDAWRSDQQDIRTRLHQTARSAGRDPATFLHEWVMSLARMPDNEFESLQCARYSRVAEVRLEWSEHGRRTGHSTPRNGWRGSFVFRAVSSAYFGNLIGGSK